MMHAIVRNIQGVLWAQQCTHKAPPVSLGSSQL